jgi:N-acyl homoserine lactone hydrolase
MQIHAIQTGRLTGNETVMRGDGWSAVFRRRAPYEFPAFSFLVEHPEGLIAIDSGLTAEARVPRSQRAIAPVPSIDPGEEIGPRMEAAGLAPSDVRKVVLTHLDWDHAGGLRHFPDAEVLIHRPEWEFAGKLRGRWRYQPKLWPSTLEPSVYDLDAEPFGPFPESRAVTDAGDIRVVPIPGHSIGQVGVIVETGGGTLFFAADHVLRQDWFLEDYAAGHRRGLGALFFPKLAEETSGRIHSFLQERPVVFLPSHDAETPARLSGNTPAQPA